MANDRFVRFERKQDNVNEIIAAEDVNTLQRVAETTQKDIYIGRDQDFLDRALFTLQHHRIVNGMWVDTFEDTTKIDIAKTKYLVFSEPEQAIIFPDGTGEPEGWLYSNTWTNPNSTLMKKVIVMAQYSLPAGTDLIIEVSNDGATWFQPIIGDSEPFEIPTDGQRLKLRARFVRSDLTATPRLEAWAVLFKDPANNIVRMPDGSPINIGNGGDGSEQVLNIYHNQLKGIGTDDHHAMLHTHDGTDGSGLVSHLSLTDIGPDDHHSEDHQHGTEGVSAVNLASDVIGTLPISNLAHQVWLGTPGQTGLFFDPKLGDRLSYVKTPDDETYLFYDMNNGGRLDHTITILRGVAAWETLIYGPYTNSQGAVTTVMLGTEKNEYDATSDEIQRELQKLIAPDGVKGIAASDPRSGGAIQVTWVANKEFDLVGYNVYMSTNSISWTKTNTTPIVGVAYTVANLLNNTPYYFKVTAVDATEYESVDSSIVTATPTLADTIAPIKPTGLNGVGGNGTVNLSWAANTESDLATYAIYRSPSGLVGSFLRITTLNKPTVSYTDTGGIVAGSQYYYRMTAIDTSGNESTPSDNIVVTA